MTHPNIIYIRIWNIVIKIGSKFLTNIPRSNMGKNTAEHTSSVSRTGKAGSVQLLCH